MSSRLRPFSGFRSPSGSCCFLLLLLAVALPISAMAESTSAPSPLTAEEIMARVAANQDKTESERNHYLYTQHARVVSRKGSTLRCEETTDIQVLPSAKGSHQQLIKLDGRVYLKGKYVPYNHLLLDSENPQTPAENAPAKGPAPAEDKPLTMDMDENADISLVEGVRNSVTNDADSESKDGIGSHLFPLTSKSQADYTFNLAGRERLNDRDVYHITFGPKETADFGWKGDAYIDANAYQPVVVTTAMNRKLPFAVRTFLGTSLPGLGFTVVYAPQPGGVWFPTNFSTEFRIKVLFFFSREMTIDVRNIDFRRTHGEGVIVDIEDADPPPADSDPQKTSQPQDPQPQAQHPQQP